MSRKEKGEEREERSRRRRRWKIGSKACEIETVVQKGENRKKKTTFRVFLSPGSAVVEEISRRSPISIGERQ